MALGSGDIGVSIVVSSVDGALYPSFGSLSIVVLFLGGTYNQLVGVMTYVVVFWLEYIRRVIS